MEQLLFTIHFIRILSHSNGHGNDGLCAHAHQFLDQPVLYGSKSRKAVKHHYTAFKIFDLDRDLRSTSSVSSVVIK